MKPIQELGCGATTCDLPGHRLRCGAVGTVAEGGAIVGSSLAGFHFQTSRTTRSHSSVGIWWPE